MLLNILKNADVLRLVLETSLNNTVPHPHSFEDFNCGGCIANAGTSMEQSYTSNSELAIANGSVLGKSVTKALAGSMTVSRDLPEPFTGGAGSVTHGNITLLNIESSDQLNRRGYEDQPAAIKVGGLISKGKSNEEHLDYSDYETWIDGKLVGYDLNNDTIDVTLGMKSDELSGEFPRNRYSSGLAEGRAKPYIFGRVEGFSPEDLGDGFYQFHDGQVDTDDFIYDFPPVAYINDRGTFTHAPVDAFTSSAVDDSGYTTANKSDFSWTIDTSGKAVSDLTLDVEAELISGDGLTLESNGQSFSVVRDDTAANVRTFRQHNFAWQVIDSQNIRVDNDLKLNVSTTGDVVIDEVNPKTSASWFKIDAFSGSGTVTMEFEEGWIVQDMDMYIRAIRTPLQTADNFDPQFDSINPPFNAAGDDTVHNHRIKYRGVGTNTISFDYSETGAPLRTAIVIERVTLVKPTRAKIKFDFPNSGSLSTLLLGFGASNDSISFEGVSTPNLSSTTSDDFDIYQLSSDSGFRSFILDVEIPFGSIELFLDETKYGDNEYGAFVTGSGYELKPPPDVNNTVTSASFIVPVIDYKLLNDDPINLNGRWKIEFDAEISSGDLNVVDLLLGSDFPNEVVKIGRDSGRFSINSKLYLSQILFSVLRTDLDGNGFNDDVDFGLTISNIKITSTYGSGSEINLFDNKNGVLEVIPTYRVSDVYAYSNLTEGLALYDSNGFALVADTYTGIAGDFNGSDKDMKSIAMLRKMSLLANGTDYIDCDFLGSRVGIAFTEQRSFLSHLDFLCNGMDYFYIEKEITDGLIIKQRYDYNSHPSDFTLETSGPNRKRDIIYDSLVRTGSEDRVTQYVVNYRRNAALEQKTKKIESAVRYRGNGDPVQIYSAFYNRSDNEDLASRIDRDAEVNDIWECQLEGIGRGLEVGMAGIILDERLPYLKPCIIMQISEEVAANSDVRTTRMIFKVLKGRGSYNG